MPPTVSKAHLLVCFLIPKLSNKCNWGISRQEDAHMEKVQPSCECANYQGMKILLVSHSQQAGPML